MMPAAKSDAVPPCGGKQVLQAGFIENTLTAVTFVHGVYPLGVVKNSVISGTLLELNPIIFKKMRYQNSDIGNL
jgi:hypothetical protein